jgi:CRISPR-associated protein Cas4
MEPYITLSFLNDFIFCPRSIYFHQLYGGLNDEFYKQKPQIAGEAAHSSIGSKSYSTRKDIMQNIEVFSEKYNICGKIDIFDCKTGRLTERKREIKTIYDGYVFQVYAQCQALREMGYAVNEIVIHDMVHNKNYSIPLPENDSEMQSKFEKLIFDINNFDIGNADSEPNQAKCERCIYSQLCDVSLC